MARTESTIVQIHPELENERIQLAQRFGWSLHSRQEMRVRGDSHVQSDWIGSGATRVTKITHYVKLHFNRPMSMSGRQELASLEQEFFGMTWPSVDYSGFWAGVGVMGLVSVSGVLALLIGVVSDGLAGLVSAEGVVVSLLFLFGFPGLTIAAGRWVRRSKSDALERQAEAEARAAAILARADQLLED